MSAYTTETLIRTAIPQEKLIEALDDDRDGPADADQLSNIIIRASGMVDALHPTASESVRSEAATVFACEIIYDRTEAKPNRFKERADAKRKELKELAGGTAIAAPKPSISAPTHTFTREHQDGL